MTRPPRTAARFAGVSGVVAVAVVVVGALAGCSSSGPDHAQPSAEATYGAMPSYLRGISTGTDGLLDGTAKRPALTSEGDTVRLHLADGATVLATVTGPVVPGEGLPHQGETTTCTWTVSLRHASQATPVSLDDLTTIDQLGNVYRLTSVPGKAAPPSELRPGDRSTFEVRTVMKVGEGVMRWAPGGGRPVAEWDFEVEND